MLKAEITWNGEARTNYIGKQRFKKGLTEVVSDPELIVYCRASKGFSVQMLAQPPVSAEESMPRGAKFVVNEEPAIEEKVEPPGGSSAPTFEIEEEPDSMPRPSRSYRSKK